jgi:hypothetical protein
MWEIDLTAVNKEISIGWNRRQYIKPDGAIVDVSGKDEAWYVARHVQTFSATKDQALKLWGASKRFAMKTSRGRYTYVQPGGALGWVASRPGKRGVNCSDFVIKILNESGIASLGYRLFDAPIRVSGS